MIKTALIVAALLVAATASADTLATPVVNKQGTTLAVTGSISATNPSVSTNTAAGPSSSTQIGGQDGSNNLQVLRVNGSGALRIDGSLTTQPVSGTFWQATQPISATQLPVALDGSGFLKVHEQGTATVSGTVTLGAGSAVVGHVIADTGSTTAVTGNVTVVQPTGSNLHVAVDSAPTTTVTGTVAATQSGGWTVTANAGSNLNTSSLALDATLTGGATKAIARGGAKGATAAADVTSTAQGVDHQAVDVQIMSGGSAKDPTQVRALTSSDTVTAVQATGSNLHVAVDSAPTTTVTGTVTANAGSNLNTSALALDATLTGGTQTSRITDGTNTAKVQAASTPAAAADKALVVSLSPNSPLGAGSAVIGHVIADTGSTTAVTGNVTVVQPTGTNLHVVLDTTSTTAVTQATGTNLHAVLDATSTTTVTQATGSNLHVAVDSAPTTAVTSAAQDPAFIAPAATSAPTKAVVVMGKSADGTPVYNPIPLAAGSASVVISGAVSGSGTFTTSDTHTTAALPLSCRLSDGAAFYAGPTTAQLPTALDGSGFLKTHEQGTATVTGAVALSAGSAVIGHVIADTGSTTAVTQATGTNLHAVLDATSTTAVTQATGTNLHVVTDATSVLAANQSVNISQVGGNAEANGGANGSLAVGGTATNNAAITQNPLLIGAEAQSGQPAAATTGNQRQLVSSLEGSLYVLNGGPTTWTCGATGLAASLTQCQAAPSAGLFLYVDEIVVQTTTATAGTFAVTCGTGTNCGTTNVALFPISGASNRWTAPINTSPTAFIPFPVSLKCPTAAQELCIIGVATNTINIQVVGHTAH